MTKTVDDILKEFPGWELQEHNKMAMWEGYGSITSDKGKENERTWQFGTALGAPVLLLHTDIPHPDNDKFKCTFFYNGTSKIEALTEALIEGGL